MLTKQCVQCNKTFKIDDRDLEFYKKITVSQPTHCPDCRQQRRLAQINQLFLYSRKCNVTGKTLISNHHTDQPYPVYDSAYWHSDQWDPTEYGRDFDFARPFFEQWQELSRVVPRPALTTAYEFDQNSPYTNYAGKNKNCYMIFDSDENEDCYYSYSLNSCKQCLDCYRSRKLELCYECVDCTECYGSWFLQDCVQCNFSTLLKDCVDVSNSIMCVGLRHKEYYILNKPVAKEVFEKTLQDLKSRHNLKKYRQQFTDFVLKFPNKFMHGSQNEKSFGDYLLHCQNASNCYDSSDLEKCSYIYQAFGNAKDSMDCDEIGMNAELMYECTNVGYTSYGTQFSMDALSDIINVTYSDYCFHSQNLFGCIGMNKRKFCILNKQYSESDYQQLRDKIIEHMRTTGEWGEFFPITTSSFAYNETLAQSYYPLTELQAKNKGYHWRIQVLPATSESQAVLPATAAEITPELVKHIFTCIQCSRKYKFLSQELVMYQAAGIPLPTQCFYCRNTVRQQQRNPRQLWQRQCMCTQIDHNHQGRCTNKFPTTYSPDRVELVYCEQCYQKEIY
ncbi:MAG: hypothetical protein WCW27_03105 [Patescibacteria group bacterium]|jgi:hypothetical protein